MTAGSRATSLRCRGSGDQPDPVPLPSAAITLLVAGFPLVLIVLAGHLGATPGLIGVILGVSGIGGLLGALLAPLLIRTIPAGWLNIAGMWIWGMLIALLALVPSAMALGGPATCAVLGSGLLLVAAAATASPTIRHADLPPTATG